MYICGNVSLLRSEPTYKYSTVRLDLIPSCIASWWENGTTNPCFLRVLTALQVHTVCTLLNAGKKIRILCTSIYEHSRSPTPNKSGPGCHSPRLDSYIRLSLGPVQIASFGEVFADIHHRAFPSPPPLPSCSPPQQLSFRLPGRRTSWGNEGKVFGRVFLITTLRKHTSL